MNRSCTYCAIIVFLHFHMHAIFTRVYSIFKANTVPTKLKSMSMSRIIYWHAEIDSTDFSRVATGPWLIWTCTLVLFLYCFLQNWQSTARVVTCLLMTCLIRSLIFVEVFPQLAQENQWWPWSSTREVIDSSCLEKKSMFWSPPAPTSIMAPSYCSSSPQPP